MAKPGEGHRSPAAHAEEACRPNRWCRTDPSVERWPQGHPGTQITETVQPRCPATYGRFLAGLRTSTLILQGECDSFGRREEEQAYSLSPQVQRCWIPSGDQSFKPIRSSWVSEAENCASAVALGDQFLRGAARDLSSGPQEVNLHR